MRLRFRACSHSRRVRACVRATPVQRSTERKMTAAYQFRATFLAAILSIGLANNVASAESGNDESRDWIISGTELIKALEGISDNGAPQGEAGGIMSRARGSAYIAGVADATSGTGWCGAGSVLPHELTDRVYTHLRSVTPERLKGSASTLVIETLAAIYPCPAN
ncbi:Rap1a/Tai family immunity protein [Rhizobium rhizogenes]|uniref:Rap1a/Tai family immunity protein n=1 Tax=Rhizobium rhizogenes TaxID=359 RepID=UPI0035AC14BD